MIEVPEDGWGADALDRPGMLLGGARPPEPSLGMPDWLGSNDDRTGDPLDDADSMRVRAGAVFRRQRSIGAFNRELDTVLASIAETPDWSDGLERFDRKAGELRQRHAGDLSSPEDREAFARHAGEFAAMQRIGLKRALVERQGGDAPSQLDDQLTYYVGKAAGADNEVFRQIALDSGTRAIEELQQAGYLTPEAAKARRTAFLNQTSGADAEDKQLDDVGDNPNDLSGLIRLAGNLLDSGLNAPEANTLKALLEKLLSRGRLPKRPPRSDDEPQAPPSGSPTPAPPRLPKPPVVSPLESGNATPERPPSALALAPDAQDGVVQRIRDLRNHALRDRQAHGRETLGPLTPEAAEYINRILADARAKSRSPGKPVDVSGFEHTVDAEKIRHIINEHIGENESDSRNLPLTLADLEKIPEILAAPDSIRVSRAGGRNHPPSLIYSKRFNGTVYVVEEVQPRAGELSVDTMYKHAVKEGGSGKP